MQGAPCIPDSHPYRVTRTKCRIDTVISPDDGHIFARKHAAKRNKHTKKNCAPSWLYLQDDTGMHGQQNITKSFYYYPPMCLSNTQMVIYLQVLRLKFCTHCTDISSVLSIRSANFFLLDLDSVNNVR
jgi:hypothetical protein